MKNSLFLLLSLSVVGAGLLVAHWSSAQSKNQPSSPQADTGLALHQLELLVAHLDANKDTKGMELLTDYQQALDAQQASAAISLNIRIILQKLHEGRTPEVITWQEDRLISDAITLYASYNQLSPAAREKLSLRSIGYVRDYFAKYPRTNQTAIQKEALAKAFQLLDEKSGNKK